MGRPHMHFPNLAGEIFHFDQGKCRPGRRRKKSGPLRSANFFIVGLKPPVKMYVASAMRNSLLADSSRTIDSARFLVSQITSPRADVTTTRVQAANENELL